MKISFKSIFFKLHKLYFKIRTIHPAINSAFILIPSTLLVVLFSPFIILWVIFNKLYYFLKTLPRFKDSIYLVFKSISLYIFFNLLFIIVFWIPIGILFAFIHVIPIYFKWPFLGGTIYILFLIYVTSLDHKDEIEKSLKEDSWNSYNKEMELVKMEDHSNNKIIKFIANKGYLMFIILAALILIGGIFLLIIFSFTINEIFPSLFFDIPPNSIVPIKKWCLYYFVELLNVIPVDFITPFIPEIESFDPTNPWGKVLNIFCQINLTFILYTSIYLIFLGHRINAYRKSNLNYINKPH